MRRVFYCFPWLEALQHLADVRVADRSFVSEGVASLCICQRAVWGVTYFVVLHLEGDISKLLCNQVLALSKRSEQIDMRAATPKLLYTAQDQK
jgi:hypothetical protein